MSTTPFRESCNFCNNKQDKIDRLTNELEKASNRPTYTLKVGDVSWGIRLILTLP